MSNRCNIVLYTCNTMIKPEKFHESFPKTVLRTAITAVVLTIIFYFGNIFQANGNKLKVFGISWASIMCITFGGHWTEILFINYLKYYLPKNLAVLFAARIIMWYATAIVLFFISQYVFNTLSGSNQTLGGWQVFGFVYILIQMIIHGIIHLQIKKSFWNGVY